MQLFKLWLLVLLVGLSGCGENKEKKSDPKVLLSEKEVVLPKSTLLQYDKAADNNILSGLPSAYIESPYTYESLNFEDSSNSLTINKIVFAKNNMYIYVTANSNGKIHLLENTCTKFGFWKCGGWGNFLYNIKDLKTGKRHNLSKIQDVSFDLNKVSEKSRVKLSASTYNVYDSDASVEFIKLDLLDSNNFTLVFDNVKQTLKRFSLKEGYDGTWNFNDLSLGYSKEEMANFLVVDNYLKKFKLDSISIKTLESIYNKYSKYEEINNLILKNILFRIKKKNSIVELHEFNSKYASHTDRTNESIGYLFDLVKIKDSVAGYEWFINHYANSKYSKSALDRIQEIMFEKAQRIDTIAAYDSFVFSYPTAKQVKEANEIANDKEKDIYTNLGVLGFWDTDHKKEIKSRKFLIKAKQIERFPRDNDLRGNRKTGYLIVADRMYKLLQEEFDESDATLRHLESQEFKDFVSDFKSAMSNIQYTLKKIEDNTNNMSRYSEEMVSISKRGFSDAKADRAMAAYHEKKKTEWDKFMHYRDKGYN